MKRISRILRGATGIIRKQFFSLGLMLVFSLLALAIVGIFDWVLAILILFVLAGGSFLGALTRAAIDEFKTKDS
jgi:hypothetical protein